MRWTGRGAASRVVAGLVATLAAVIAPSASAQVGGQTQVVLAPHRAIYDFTLARSSAGGVSDMTGRMVYELTGSPCDGYTQSMRFVTRGITSDGASAISDLRTSSYEDAKAETFKFSSSQYQDQKLSDQTSGDAERRKDGVSVALKRPGTKTLALKPDVLFPIQHSVQLIEAALRSERLFRADLYDGSDKGEKVFSTLAVIGPTRAAGHNSTLPAVANAERLDKMRAWSVAMSYFEPVKAVKDAAPTYELGFLFFENGVTRKLTLDYGQFALKGDLAEITFQEPASCEPKKR